MSGDILLFVEQREGGINAASLQLFTLAADLVRHSEGRVHAAVLGHELGDIVQTIASYPVASVLVADDAELHDYRPQPYVRMLQRAIEKTEAGTVLMATTSLGRDLAPRIAARTKAALATDCTAVDVDDGRLVVKRPMYCAKCVGRFVLGDDRLNVLSVRPNTFSTPEPDPSASTAIEALETSFSDDELRLETLEVVRTSQGVKDVAEADIIVSGGRSLKSEENFGMLYEMAEVLDAAVGASRAAVDAGYQPHSRQVGLTGKVVTPRLYLAFGIDGAIQHLAGMRSSKVIVAINTKREAPIFDVATYGCVADLFTMAPLLTEEFRRLNGTS